MKIKPKLNYSMSGYGQLNKDKIYSAIIDGNRQQAISKCFFKYEKQGYSTYYILKG